MHACRVGERQPESQGELNHVDRADASKRSSRVRQAPKWLRDRAAAAVAAPDAAHDSSCEGSGGSTATQATPTPQQPPAATATATATGTALGWQPSPAAVPATAPGATCSAAADAAADAAAPATDNPNRSPTTSSGCKRRQADSGGPGSGNKAPVGRADPPKRGKRAAPAAARGSASPGPAQPGARWLPSDPTRFVKRESYFYCHFGRTPDARTPAQAAADEAAFLQLLQASTPGDEKPHAASAATKARRRPKGAPKVSGAQRVAASGEGVGAAA